MGQLLQRSAGEEGKAGQRHEEQGWRRIRKRKEKAKKEDRRRRKVIIGSGERDGGNREQGEERSSLESE